MRLREIHAAKVNPVKLFFVDNLSDVVVLAGPNGVGKTRLIDTTLASFRHPHLYRGEGSQPNLRLIIEATSQAEKQAWGQDRLPVGRCNVEVHRCADFRNVPWNGEFSLRGNEFIGIERLGSAN